MPRNSASQPGKSSLHRVRERVLLSTAGSAGIAESPRECLVVGVGAPPSSMEALTKVIGRLPSDLQAAIVIVSAHPIEQLREALRYVCTLPIERAVDGVAAQPGTIYCSPAEALVAIVEGQFQVSLPAARTPAQPIDTLFHSLAQNLSVCPIGVVLGKTGLDGCSGLKAIHTAGGIALVENSSTQDQLQSDFPGTFNRPLALPAEELAATIVGLAAHPLQTPAGRELQVRDDQLEEIHRILARETSTDLRYLQPDRVRLRVLRRIALRQIGGTGEYLHCLRNENREVDELFRDLITYPSAFLEEPAYLNRLQTAVQRAVESDPDATAPLRAWTPFCSTGEGTYSVAMAMIETLEQRGASRRVQIFGTDLNAYFLQIARSGQFPEWVEPEIASARFPRFFERQGYHYAVRNDLRRCCLFARQNLLSDPPLSRMDLIDFRGRLASIVPAMQERVLRLFHFALRPGGVLALSPSDTVEAAPQFARTDDPGIYIRRDDPNRTWLFTSVMDGQSILAISPAEAHTPAPEIQEPVTLNADHRWEERTKNARHHLRALLEEQAHTIEALKLANEEITCSNEELQASNEELAATREEVQARNQELQMVNDELQSRNLEMARTSSEVSTLLRNLRLAVVTVDNELRVRRFTQEAGALFSLGVADMKRPITDFNPKLQIPGLESLLKDTIGNLASHDLEVRDANGERYRLLIRPYRTEDHRIDGAILTALPAE